MTISIHDTGELAARLRRILTYKAASKCAPREIVLASDAVWSCESRPGQTVTAREGLLWLTQTGDATDYLLHVGQSFTATRAGRVVVQAVKAGSFGLDEMR